MKTILLPIFIILTIADCAAQQTDYSIFPQSSKTKKSQTDMTAFERCMKNLGGSDSDKDRQDQIYYCESISRKLENNDKPTEKSKEVTREERGKRIDELKLAWHACIYRSAVSLDDGISSAGDIAEAVKYGCQAEHNEMDSAMAMSPQVRAMMRNDLPETTKTLATRFVLQNRAMKRQENRK